MRFHCSAKDMTMTLFDYLKVLIVTIVLALLGNQTSWATEASFSWLANDSADGTVGYILYCGTSSRQYTESVDVGLPTPTNGRVYASMSQLIPGQTYFFTVTAYNNQGYESPYPNEVVYTVPSDTSDTSLYDIYMSTSSNLSGAVLLDESSVDGDMYVFTGPDTGVSKVTFSIDGVVSHTETKAPYELVGGAAYDTSQLSSGEHQMSAMMYLNDGSTKLISADFTIPSAYDDSGSSANDSTEKISYDVLVTTSPSLLGAVSLDGAIVSGDIYVLTGPDTGVSKVTFSVDGVGSHTETKAPYELVGGSPYDASQLSPGQHELTAKMYLSDGSTESITADFTVPSIYDDTDSSTTDSTENEDFHDILVSTSSDLSGATVLDGNTVDGDLYIFTGPDTGVSQVIFSIDGKIFRTERKAPFELVGGAAYDTSELSPGEHEITAEFQLDNGNTEVVSAIVTIPSYTDSHYEILVSDTAYLSGAAALDGTTVAGDIYVFTGPDTGVSKVIFSVDGETFRTERKAPFELVGGAAFNASELSRGTHQISASIQLEDGTSEWAVAQFTVN